MTALEKAARALEARLKERGFLDYEEGVRAVISSIEVDDAMVQLALDTYWDADTASGPPSMRAALTAFLRSILEDGAGT